MNWTEWLNILKTDKLIALVIALGSITILYLSEISKVIDLPNTWRNIFFCTSIFCGLFLILSLVVSLSGYLKKLYINRDRDITSHEYECLEFFSRLPNQGHGVGDISGIDETEKRYLLSELVEKGFLSSYMDYYSLTDKGREKILEERRKKTN